MLFRWTQQNKNLHHPRNFDIVKFYFIVQCWALYGNMEFTKNFYWRHKLGKRKKNKPNQNKNTANKTNNKTHITAHLLDLHSALLTVVKGLNCSSWDDFDQ